MGNKESQVEVVIPVVSEEQMKVALNSSIYHMQGQFMSTIIQSINIYFSNSVPRAGVKFSNDHKQFEMFLNPHYFCNILTTPQRIAVLYHELSHILHKHLIRIPFIKLDPQMRSIMNIAADMAINQYIQDLPMGCPMCDGTQGASEEDKKAERCPNPLCPGKCIFLEDFYDTDKAGNKIPWEDNKTTEYYYEKYLTRLKESKDGEGSMEAPWGKGGQGQGKEFDSHDWDSGAEEKDVLDGADELVKRAMIKKGLSYDQLPKYAQELLDHIDSRKAELNYRAMILSAIKRHASGHNRKSTWSRRNRRFGNKAPGTKIGDMPKLQFHIDMSGSISIEEANEFLSICDEFLRNGARKSQLNLFHTRLFYSTPYKLGDRLDRSKVESGGTDLTETMEHIVKTQPDLAIVLTDGCYGDVDIESMKKNNSFPQTIFIISKGGTEEHPLKRAGTTIKVPA